MTDCPFGAPGMKNITNAGEPARYPVHRIFCAGRRNAAHAPETGAGADRKAWLRCRRTVEPSRGTSMAQRNAR